VRRVIELVGYPALDGERIALSDLPPVLGRHFRELLPNGAVRMLTIIFRRRLNPEVTENGVVLYDYLETV